MSIAEAPTERPREGTEPTLRSGWYKKLCHVGWQIYHHATKHTGVGIVCSVAYFDPGNWGVDLQAGSQFGYSLLFTVLLAGIFATFFQVLACRLGVVTGLDLASHCRLLFHDRPRHKLLWRWGVFYPLYLLSEIAIICTDLAEMLGSAIALSILFPALPLWSTVLLTAADVMLLLAIENPLKSRPVKLFEWTMSALAFAVLICMLVLISRIPVDWGDAFYGFVPSKELFSRNSLYTSVGIIGATVMPHSLFLGSHLATQDRLANSSEQDLPSFYGDRTSLPQRMLRFIRHTFSWRRLFSISRSDETLYPPNVRMHADRENNSFGFIKSHVYHGMANMIASLMGFAIIINSLILIISSAVFYYNSGAYGNESPASLFDADSLIRSTVGRGAGILFALALLASGQSASIVATVAGQSVSEGFLRWKVSPTLRRLITRLLGLIPAVIVASVVGRNGINTLLVASQVALSIILPFVVLPLIYLTSSSRIMSIRTGANHGSTSRDSPRPSSIHGLDRADTMRDKEDIPGELVVDFSNGKISQAIGYIMWLVILAANVYALVTL